MSITCSYTRGTKKIPFLFPQIIKTPEINVSNVFSVVIAFEIQLSFCLQEKKYHENDIRRSEECKTLRDSPFLEIPRFRDSL